MDFVGTRNNARRWAEGQLAKDGPGALEAYKPRRTPSASTASRRSPEPRGALREVAGAGQRLRHRRGRRASRALAPALVRAVCDRHTGIGADGLLVLAPPDAPGFVARLRIFNPDGSEAERAATARARRSCTCAAPAGPTRGSSRSRPPPARSARRSSTETTCRVDMGRAPPRPRGRAARRVPLPAPVDRQPADGDPRAHRGRPRRAGPAGSSARRSRPTRSSPTARTCRGTRELGARPHPRPDLRARRRRDRLERHRRLRSRDRARPARRRLARDRACSTAASWRSRWARTSTST